MLQRVASDSRKWVVKWNKSEEAIYVNHKKKSVRWTGSHRDSLSSFWVCFIYVRIRTINGFFFSVRYVQQSKIINVHHYSSTGGEPYSLFAFHYAPCHSWQIKRANKILMIYYYSLLCLFVFHIPDDLWPSARPSKWLANGWCVVLFVFVWKTILLISTTHSYAWLSDIFIRFDVVNIAAGTRKHTSLTQMQPAQGNTMLKVYYHTIHVWVFA